MASASVELFWAAALTKAPRFATPLSDLRLTAKAVACVGVNAPPRRIRSVSLELAPMARNAARLICSSSEGDLSRSNCSTELLRFVTVSAAPTGPLMGNVAALKVKPPAQDAQATSSNSFWRAELVL